MSQPALPIYRFFTTQFIGAAYMSSSGLVSAASKTLKQFYTHSPAAVYKINVRG